MRHTYLQQKENKVKAREDFLRGEAIHKVANKLHIHRQTLYNWIEKGNWEEEKEKMAKQVIQNMNIDLVEEKQEDLKVFEAIKQIYKVELNKQIAKKELAELPKNTDTFSRAMKTKWEILIPKTISQFNYMRQENTLNQPTYTFEIIKPDDNKNAVEAEQQTTGSV